MTCTRLKVNCYEMKQINGALLWNATWQLCYWCLNRTHIVTNCSLNLKTIPPYIHLSVHVWPRGVRSRYFLCRSACSSRTRICMWWVRIQTWLWHLVCLYLRVSAGFSTMVNICFPRHTWPLQLWGEICWLLTMWCDQAVTCHPTCSNWTNYPRPRDHVTSQVTYVNLNDNRVFMYAVKF